MQKETQAIEDSLDLEVLPDGQGQAVHQDCMDNVEIQAFPAQ